MQQSNTCTQNYDSSIDDQHVDVSAIMQLSQNTIKMLCKFQKEILQSKQHSIQDLNNILDLIKKYIVKIKGGITFIQEAECLEDGFQELKQFIQDNYEIKEKLNMWLSEEQEKGDVDYLFQILNNQNIESNEDEAFNCKTWKSKKLTISTLNIQSDHIQINSSNSLLFSSNGDQVKLYGFNSCNKLIKTLNQKQSNIMDLLWLKKSEQLLSIGFDSDIIWNNDYQPQQIFEKEENSINCIISNDNDDLFTGGEKLIRFWKKKDFTWSCLQTFEIIIIVSDFSFNPSQTKLISQGYQYGEDDKTSSYIYLIECQEELWVIVNTINIDQILYSLLYKVYLIENNQFVFIHQFFGIMEAFNYEPETKKFFRTQLIQLSNCLYQDNFIPCQYIKQTSSLMVSHKELIYFFKLDQQGQCQLQQLLKFDKWLARVVISENRNYLMIKEDDWDSNKILVLKLRNIE